MKRLLIILAALISSANAQQHYPLKEQLGVNVFGWDLGSHPDQADKDARTASLQSAIINTRFSWLRIYADASVYKDANNIVWKFNPDGRGYLTEDYIKQIRAKLPTLKVNFCYQNTPLNIANEWAATGARNTQYRHPKTDPSNPATWSELAKDLGVIAGRYGTNSNVSDYPVFISPNWWEPKQVILKGSGIANQIEGGNEYDNGYSNNPMTNGQLVSPDKPALTGSQYAVLWKASGEAIKRADPNMSVSTTGVMTEDPQILIDALAWYDLNNGGKVPFDSYQFHCYPWGWSKGIASALPPEMNMVPAAKKVVAAAKGRCKVVIGEWSSGDRHPESNMGIRLFSNYTADQISAYWVVRALLGFNMAGVYSSYYYKLRQDYGAINDNNSEQFITSNLFADNVDGITVTRRLTGDIFRQLSDFGDMVFDSALVDEPNKKVYRYKNSTQYILGGWTVENVSLVTINGTNRASFTEVKSNYSFPSGTRYDLQPGDTMKRTPFAGGSIELSTKPVFIVMGEVSKPPVITPPDTVVTPPPIVVPPVDTVVVPPPPVVIPPSPSDTVVTNFKGEWYNMEVYNIAGQLIGKYYTNNPKPIKNKLPRGIYIIKYYNDRTFFTEKYIKN
jgi:hypothetical protein